jgi:hypothetical protein
MKKSEISTWGSFKESLQQSAGSDLQFQYAENTWVNASYHITEIKQATIKSVDCGGQMSNWTEVIIQLLEPEKREQLRAMKVSKALSIIDVVERSLPLDPLAVVKIEFGNSQFDTRQMLPSAVVNDGENLIIDLRPDTVQCKAIDRGGSCGPTNEECCTPVSAKKPILEMKNLAVATSCCEPGSGCC